MFWLIVISGACFAAHLTAETLSSFVKYNYAGLRQHMTGANLSNLYAIASRAFVAGYGLAIAVVIEQRAISPFHYCMVFSCMTLIGASVAWMFSKRRIERVGSTDSVMERLFAVENLGESYVCEQKIRINGLLALVVAVQFVAVAFAYGTCLIFFEQRLILISAIPLISMLGTLVTFFLIEPRLAKIVDVDHQLAVEASSAFLRARCVSFVFSGVLLAMVGLSFAFGEIL